MLRWHLERARARIADLRPQDRPGIHIHGDFTPLWWAYLIEQACQFLASGTHDDGWLATHLLRRSPLMGPDVVEYR